jgi:hypothetical protein
MAYNTSTDFIVSRNEIIYASLRLIGVIDPEETPTTAEIANTAQAFNMMVKAFVAEGLHLWMIQERLLFFAQDQISYFPGLSTEHFVDTATFTEVQTAAASGGNEIHVLGNVNLTVGRAVGVMQDDGDYHWTTISSVTGYYMGITDALTDDAAAGNPVVHYATTSVADRPTDIHAIQYVIGGFGGPELTLERISERDYYAIPDKRVTGKPNVFYYNPRMTSGRVRLWPLPDDCEDYARLLCQVPMRNLDSSTDNPYFPIEWYEALKFNLAVRIAPEYGTSMEDRVWLKSEAKEMLANVRDHDREKTSTYFVPDLRRR